MKLEDIGFYTLEDYRAENTSIKSPLWRCELILTDRCNFSCPYCREMKDECKGDMSLQQAKYVVDYWTTHGLKNIRFSGGEPTLWHNLLALVSYTNAKKSVQRIAISTNGSADYSYYEELIGAGVNDFSISLDACCASTGDKMAGVKGKWDSIISNIEALSQLTYITVGIVLTPDNLPEGLKTVKLAHDLGVSDIRIISSAQFNGELTEFMKTNPEVVGRHRILAYRLLNMAKKRNVRGIKEGDSNKCPLVLDDMCIAGKQHFPCVIYFREGGKAIGDISDAIRLERFRWWERTDTHKDPICRQNCLDVCIDYNNKANK